MITVAIKNTTLTVNSTSHSSANIRRQYTGARVPLDMELEVSDEPIPDSKVLVHHGLDNDIGVFDVYINPEAITQPLFFCDTWLTHYFGKVPETIYFRPKTQTNGQD